MVTTKIPAETILGRLKSELETESMNSASRRNKYPYPCGEWIEEHGYHTAIRQAASLIDLLINRHEDLAVDILKTCALEYPKRYQAAVRQMTRILVDNEIRITADLEAEHTAQGEVAGWAFAHRKMMQYWTLVG